MQLVWVVKQGHIGDAFFDSDAAAFLKAELDRSRAETTEPLSILDKENSQQHGSDMLKERPTSVHVRKEHLLSTSLGCYH